MRRRGLLLLAGAVALVSACPRKNADRAGGGTPGSDGRGTDGGTARRPPRQRLAALQPGEVYVHDGKTTSAARTREAEARAARLLIVDLGDQWAPFIFQDGGLAGNDSPKPNGYRRTFVELANDRIDADGGKMTKDEHNFLEPFGIPPTLSVVRARVEADLAPERRRCYESVDLEGLRAFSGNVVYVDRERARREYTEASGDADWLSEEITRREAAAAPPAGAGARSRLRLRLDDGGGGAVVSAEAGAPRATWKVGDRDAAIAALRKEENPKLRTRLDRALRGQERTRAVRAAQARLLCEGLLSTGSRFTPGMFDLPTHEALAAWERKNDIFGWASLGGETLAALATPALELDFGTFRRVLAERIADAAAIVEDGSAVRGRLPATYDDVAGAGTAGGGRGGGNGGGGNGGSGAPKKSSHPVPDLIGEHVAALLANLRVVDAGDMVDFLAQHGPDGLATLRVALPPPALPPYYTPSMDLSVEIDRGDVWYDFPFDERGRAVDQRREHFPHATLFVNWSGQKIPLVRWRTTIGSWRSELHANGKVYYRYKNSDVGPRFWRHIVAGPVWVPPEATPAKDLLTRKVLDRNKGAELVVNTNVMGPGFQSAYGLVMAIHIDRRGFDNQIRTHGSVDYTSIARRFSHGCHRLVNNRAVRLFDFVLRHQTFRRLGSIPLALERQLVVDDKTYPFELKTRGYYYDLVKPIPVNVTEGRVMGKVKAPVTAYVPKRGVDYSDVPDPSSGDSATSLQNADTSGASSTVPGGMPAERERPAPAEAAPPSPPPALFDR